MWLHRTDRLDAICYCTFWLGFRDPITWHHSTNPAQRRVTSLIGSNVLTLCHTTNHVWCGCQASGTTHNPHLNGMSGIRRRSSSKQRQDDVKLLISWSMGSSCMLVLTSATAAGPRPLTPKPCRPHLAASDISEAVLGLRPQPQQLTTTVDLVTHGWTCRTHGTWLTANSPARLEHKAGFPGEIFHEGSANWKTTWAFVLQKPPARM